MLHFLLQYATECQKVTTYPGMNVPEEDEQIDGDSSSVRCVIDVALPEMPREILLLVSQASARAKNEHSVFLCKNQCFFVPQKNFLSPHYYIIFV